MSEEVEYADIKFDRVEARPPYRFKIGEGEGRKAWEEKFELPALDDPGLPVELLEIGLLAVSSKDEMTQGSEAISIISNWLREAHPQIIRALNRHSQTMPMFLGLIEGWTEHIKADPKA